MAKQKVKKIKKKTHKSLSKVLKVRAGGTISIGHPGGKHNTGKKNMKFNRKKRSGSTLSITDYRRIKDVI